MQVTRTTLFCVKTAGAQIHRLSVVFSVAISPNFAQRSRSTIFIVIDQWNHSPTLTSPTSESKKFCVSLSLSSVRVCRWLPRLAFFDGRQQPHCGKGFSRSKLLLLPVFQLQVASCEVVAGDTTIEAWTVCLRFGKVLQPNDVDLCLRQSQCQCPFGRQRHKGCPSKYSRQGPSDETRIPLVIV